MSSMRIFYTNLGLYNEGELVGEWVDLPVTDDELEEIKKRNGYDELHEEFFITDFETDCKNYEIGEYDSIEELNKIAELCDEHGSGAVDALVEYGYTNAEEIADHIGDVYCLCTREGSETMDFAIGWYYIHELEMLNIPEEIEQYFDYKAYGKNIRTTGNFYEAGDGSIYELRI